MMIAIMIVVFIVSVFVLWTLLKTAGYSDEVLERLARQSLPDDKEQEERHVSE